MLREQRKSMTNIYYITNTKEPIEADLILDNTISTDMFDSSNPWIVGSNTMWWIHRKMMTMWMYYDAGYSFAFSD